MKSIKFYIGMGALGLLVWLLAIGCHHHANTSPPPQTNPATYTYTSTLIATHSPGFFSALWHNRKLFLGTYATNNGGHGDLRCQLCTLESNQVKVLHTFNGESVYHIRGYPGYLFLPVEHGSLYRRNDDGTIIKLLPQRQDWGYYEALWCAGHWFAFEMIDTQESKSATDIYRDGQKWHTTTNWRTKAAVAFNGNLYLSARGINLHTETGIIKMNPETKVEARYKTYIGRRSGAITAYEGAVWTTLDNGLVVNTRGEEYNLGPQRAWFIGEIDGTLFATTGGRWRGVGPSHLYVFNPITRKFEKKLDFPDAEPWWITSAGQVGSYYLVTRNQVGNVGRVYEIVKNEK